MFTAYEYNFYYMSFIFEVIYKHSYLHAFIAQMYITLSLQFIY